MDTAVIAGDRRTGKTTRLLRLVADDVAGGERVTVVTPDHRRARLLWADLVLAGLDRRAVRVVPADYELGRQLHGVRRVYVDDVDETVEGIHHPALQLLDVVAVTCTVRP